MSRVVFLNSSAAGHVIGTLGLVVELMDRGEEIIYYEDPRFQAEIEALGACFRPYPPIQHPETRPRPQNALTQVPILTWYARETLPSLLEMVRADAPDYIIHDSFCLVGKLVSQILDIPAVNSITSAAFCHRSFYECPQVRQLFPQMVREADRSMREFRQYSKELRQKFGIPPIKLLDTFTNPEPLNICQLPRELQPYVDKFDESFYFVGSCHFVRGTELDFPMELLENQTLILIALGTVVDPGMAFYQICFTAFGDFDACIVLMLGHSTKPEQLGEVPPNFIIREVGTVPQVKLLERASLFVMHAGTGGAREAVWHSVPTIAIPHQYEQELIAQRLEAEGVGVTIHRDKVTPKELREAAQKILQDESFRHNSNRLGRACREAGGAKRAVDEILNYVRTQQGGRV